MYRTLSGNIDNDWFLFLGPRMFTIRRPPLFSLTERETTSMNYHWQGLELCVAEVIHVCL